MDKALDRVGEVYAGTHSDKNFQRHLRSRLHWTCRQVHGTRVLDVGCSQGILSLLLAREGFEVVGLDVEPTAIEFAQQALAEEPESVRRHVQFLLGEFLTADLPPASFDTIVAGEVLEHLAQPARFAARCRELLHEGGVLVVTVPFGLHPHPDHKTTFYLTTLLETVGDGWEPGALDLIHTPAGAGTPVPIMGLVLRNVAGVPAPDPTRLRAWLDFSEHAFSSAEGRYQALLDNLETQRTTLREQVAKLQASQNDLAAKERDLRAQLAPLQQQAQQSQERLAALQDDHTRLTQEAEALRAQLPPLQQQAQQSQERLAALQDDHTRLTQEAEALRTQGRELQAQLRAAGEARAALEGENAHLQRDWQSRLATAENQRAHLEREHAQLAQANSLLEAQLKTQAEKAAQDTQALRERIELLRAQLSSDEQEVADLLVERKLLREALRIWQLLEHQLRAVLKERDYALTQVRRRLGMMEDATSYRFGLLLVRCVQRPYRFFALPYRVLQLILASRKRKALKRKGEYEARLAPLARDLQPVPDIRTKRSVDFVAQVRPRDAAPSAPAPAVQASPAAPPAPARTGPLRLPPPVRPLPEAPEIEIPAGPVRRTDLHVAAILDEFSWPCFRYECDLMRITPGNWRRLFEAQRPDFLFVESAWRGNDNQWRYMITNTRTKERGPAEPLLELVAWCKDQGIPTVFWNKEDPPNFDIFLQAAAIFDYVFTTDANCIPRYVEALNHDRVYALPFAAQPALHNPRPVPGGRPYPVAFAGTWYARKHPDRQAQADAILRPGLDYGLHIYDRMQDYALAQRDYLWPEEYGEHIVGCLPYDRMISAYRQYRAFLNVNSVTDSPTMLSRRVFELLACGTPVISGESLAIRHLLGADVVLLSDREEQTRQHLERVLHDEGYRQDLATRACLHILENHTYSHRFEELVRVLRLPQGNVPVALPLPEAELRRLAREGQAGHPQPRASSVLLPPSRPAPKDLAFDERLDAYLTRVAACDSEYFVFMFSGTTFIQERRGNRPIKMANVLLEQNVPTLFSYYRWQNTEPIADDHHPLLFQSPIDLTQVHMDRIMEYPFPGKKKLFVAAFPHLLCARSLEALHAHGWVTLYDAQDDWEQFHKVGHAKWYRQELEHFITSRSDLACAVAGPLCRKLQSYRDHAPVLLLPNALDTTFLMPFNAGRTAPRGGDAILGYFGHLSPGWFDWEGLIEIATRKPKWRFDIIGHFEPKGLQLPPNLRLLGSRTHLEINELSGQWRAGIIPFRIGPLSDGVDPIKIYEYLALGLPTVSFTMPQIAGYPYVHLAGSVDQFIAQVETAVSQQLDRRQIDAWLAHNRWEDRVATILQWTDDVLAHPEPLKAMAFAEAAS